MGISDGPWAWANARARPLRITTWFKHDMSDSDAMGVLHSERFMASLGMVRNFSNSMLQWIYLEIAKFVSSHCIRAKI